MNRNIGIWAALLVVFSMSVVAREHNKCDGP